ncbi:hypothetical protein KY290_000144 [Solanum tuberosum]|uniref:Leucine-rich repeat-containing N-terminal plant-type domain-containing protein n=1 Tax=Solanum tuberosum TaxID=4113 RepID=A0ABQ7WIG0_SOLTU|nr:hypothetical protein KY290_000144 [Solanum tuberosum]
MFTINPNASDFCYDIITDQEIQSYPRTLFWNKSTDCCSWNGVHCDETTGQVIELDLHCSQLQGKFHSNSSLFQLFNLKRLDLSYNDFTRSLISPKFGKFSSLTHLDLSDSSFTGIMPSEISHLSKLQVLRFSGLNELSLGPHNFEMLLKNLTQLRELNLDSVNISSTIPLNFSSYLTTLRLPYTELHGVLPEIVFHLSDLEFLDLSGNPQLTVRFPTTKWNSSASLMKLYLSRVNFTGSIPESFSHLTSLHELNMSDSNLSGPIPKPLWNLTNIESLLLSHNHLEGLIFQFSIFEKLKKFFIQFPNWYNSIQHKWTVKPTNTPLVIKQLEWDYTYLDILPSFTESLEGPIPKSILNQQSLLALLLSNNNISGQIDSAICNLKTLALLDLRSNNLEGTIPQCLGAMSTVWILDLSNNSRSGTINTTFSIGNRLNIIKLDRNKLEGKVPPSLINCRKLQLLDLGNNELNDTFPKWLGGLPHLQILKLRSNKFYGPIRTGNLFAQIRVIDLSSNGFSGELPVSLFQNFQAMKTISENSGTREYVADIYNYYYKNSLIVTTKGLDHELSRVLTTQIIIDLSRNRFEGCIPSIIGDPIGLRTLNLSHNVLEGHIPESLQHLSVLESLDLSSNKLGGEISQQLVSLTSLEVLNLSHNHLFGCIPKGNQFNTFENNSYQGNDGLCGLPLSRDCDGDDRVSQATIPVEQDQEEEEEDSPMISWQAVLMGYGCGLVIGLIHVYRVSEDADKILHLS